jgi:hypothetical protein
MASPYVNLHRADLDINGVVLEYLNSHIQDIESPDPDGGGNTPLLSMCIQQSWRNAEIFIEMGCDINTVNKVRK